MMPHIPVLYEPTEIIIKNFQFNSVIDCTFGAGGHTKLFSKYINTINAMDRDPSVIKFTENIPNLNFINDKFSNISKYFQNSDLIYADLGLSTMQIESDRGFSFMTNSDLDMRMDMDGLKLKHILNKMPIFKLKEIFQKYGEEPSSNKIAHNIERYRLKKEINSTFDLREAIGIDKFPVLARIFQALRIYINQEMEELEILLKSIPKMTDTSLIITFHSLEDRLVKNSFKQFKYSGFILPSEEEIKNNTKSRSAKLRFASNIYDINTLFIKN